MGTLRDITETERPAESHSAEDYYSYDWDYEDWARRPQAVSSEKDSVNRATGIFAFIESLLCYSGACGYTYSAFLSLFTDETTIVDTRSHDRLFVLDEPFRNVANALRSLDDRGRIMVYGLIQRGVAADDASEQDAVAYQEAIDYENEHDPDAGWRGEASMQVGEDVAGTFQSEQDWEEYDESNDPS